MLGKIPIDQSSFYAEAYREIVQGNDPAQSLSKDPPKNWYKEELDKRMGRSNRQRVATSIDEMIQDQKRIGRNNG